ncbi:Vitamin B12 import ATP-binding protein BtuD [bioreactor metagenome]|uniref:Vitamin B12 import ATP-binding protein BtuD n=1 Tax=bioreactor metagenome TaxID=1076179 RepID=A0A644XU42_9ZZZZ
MWKSRGKTVVIAEHRLHWLVDLCDRVIYMNNGRIASDLPMNEFAALPSEKLCELGLRPLSLKNLKNEAPRAVAGDTLELRDFSCSYDGKNRALDIKSLSLPRNGIIAVVGHNGAGKSTLSKCLCGLEKKSAGKVSLDGINCGRRAMLKKCYLVMQDVNHQLFCESVDDEVRLGMGEENEEDVLNILSQLDLSQYADRHPVSLSGGQKQRVAIASALLADKEILVLDEPTSGLDYCHMKETAALIYKLLGKRTVLIITHDPELILCSCTHVLHMENSKVSGFYPLDDSGGQRLINFFINGAK